jgi:pyrroline-5-carboxylate reductase
MSYTHKIAVLGGGNIGLSLARGLVKSGRFSAGDIRITRRNPSGLRQLEEEGFAASPDNTRAVAEAPCIVLAVLPQQLNGLLKDLKPVITPDHLIISVVSGVTTADITASLGHGVQVVRAMPNTAISLGESMTCIASVNASRESIEHVKSLFDLVGGTIEINEELMTAATALCACGIAFFLRAVRAASQGGIEIGFHAEEALHMAAQTAKGAAALLLAGGRHPESEIDKVTSPQGCTIAGLNEMEHQGFSSALIKGIRLSAAKAGNLYTREG